jgi:hypothetical protein
VVCSLFTIAAQIGAGVLKHILAHWLRFALDPFLGEQPSQYFDTGQSEVATYEPEGGTIVLTPH